MATSKDTLCACGCKEIVTPGKTWKQNHRQRLFPPSRPVRPLLERFWTKVDKTDTCWLWTGSKQPYGYGLLSREGKYVLTHRFSYELHYGPIPDGLWCLHHCDTPACVRPDHLFLGTNSDNMLDCAAKGRNPAQRDPGRARQRLRAARRNLYGERVHTAKLTAAQVREIRHTHAQGGISYAALARAFGITAQNISDIVARHIWRHLDD